MYIYLCSASRIFSTTRFAGWVEQTRNGTFCWRHPTGRLQTKDSLLFVFRWTIIHWKYPASIMLFMHCWIHRYCACGRQKAQREWVLLLTNVCHNLGVVLPNSVPPSYLLPLLWSSAQERLAMAQLSWSLSSFLMNCTGTYLLWCFV